MKCKKLFFTSSILVAFGLMAASFSCTQPFSLSDLIDGPDGRALVVSPESAQIQVGESLTIEASGGLPPYSYVIVSGDGTLSGNVYTAPLIPGVVVIKVSDKVGASQNVNLTIVNTTPALRIIPDVLTLYTGASQTFETISGTPSFVFSFAQNNSGASLIGNTYSAGPIAGTDIVQVTDADGVTAIATITVQAKPFYINPDSATVYVNQPVVFSAVGGDGPFSFSVSPASPGLGSGGSIDPVSGVYTAGPQPGEDIVTVIDAYDGRPMTAAISVLDIQSSVDYEALAVNVTSPTQTLVNSAIAANFSIRNNGSAPGTKAVASDFSGNRRQGQ